MNKESIFHQPYNNYAYPVGEDRLFVQLRAKKGDLERVLILYGDRYGDFWENNSPSNLAKMKKYASDRLYDYFKVEISLSSKRFKYLFLLDDGCEQLYYSMYGFYQEMPHYLGHFQYTYICENDIYQTPDWVKKGVFYEIMLDRFCNGDETINPDITKGAKIKIRDWNEIPDEENLRDNYYGGDLEGIINKLDYLEELGVTAIYLTPIFESPTSHKYDVINYKKIDDMFGNLKTFKKLMKKAHEKGIKVVLDFIFNHTSARFFAFQDIIDKGKESDYVGWYYITDFPVKSYFELSEDELDEDGTPLVEPNYETFANQQWDMPKIRLANKEVREYFLEVIDYWVNEIGIDGLRFDVSDEMDHYFFQQVRKFIKEKRPEVYLVGETFADASPWLRGDELDGITNYRFTYTIRNFFSRQIDVNAFEDRLAKLRIKYQNTAQLSSLNPLGSHDITRPLNILDKRAYKLAIAFQITYIGVPMVYYGDEVGMLGGEIEQRRAPMLWDSKRRDNQLYEWYKKLIKIRHDNLALQTGDFELVSKEVGVNMYSFIRRKNDNVLLIVFNRSNISTKLKFDLKDLKINTDKFIDLINSYKYQAKKDKLYIPITGYDVVILKAVF